ncbi:MAG: ABC transporter ATP-binding protein [Bacteroidia bacterium]
MSRREQLERDLPKSKFSWASFRQSTRLFRYMSPANRWLFALGTFFLAISAGSSVLFPKFLGDMLDGIFVYDPKGIQTAPNLETLYTVARWFVVLFAVQALFSFGRMAIYVKVTEGMTLGLRRDLFRSVIGQNMAFHHSHNRGDLLSRFSADIAQIQDTFTTNLAMFIRQILIMVAGLIMIFKTSADLALLMLGSFPVIVIVALFFGRFIRKISRQVQDFTASNNVIAEEALSGIVNVKAFSNEDFESERYTANSTQLMKESVWRGYWRGAFSSFIILCLFGSIVWLIYRGLAMVHAGEMGVGELVNFMLLTGFVGGSIGGMAEQFVQIQKTLGSVERVLDLIDSPTEFSSEPNADRVPPFDQELRIQNVQFAYPSRPENAVFKGEFNLTLKPGETLALVGPSGGGKSTVAQLLYRFYEPQAGQILLGDTSIHDLPLKAYRQHMAFVPQEVVLFAGSIGDNIRYGNPNATQEQIEQAAQKAYAHDFITAFADGYDTLVGDRGVLLSGGQKQRVALARAIIRNPQLLILDEATSALDAESEAWVQKALIELMKGRTALVIAHRLSTVRHADRIAVMRHGQILEIGSHPELMNLENGLYRQMVEKQIEPSDWMA